MPVDSGRVALPRTPPTRYVSHFARNQASKARSSSASPPSPDLRSLTGVRLVQRLCGSARLGVPEEFRSSRRGLPSLEVAGGREGGRRYSRGAKICGGRAEGGFFRPRAGCSAGGCRAMPWPRPKRRRSRGAPRFSRAVPLGAISAGRLRGFRGVPVVRGGVVSKV